MRQGITLLFIAALALSGCETMDSAVSSMGDGVKNVGNRIAEIDFSVPAFGRNKTHEEEATETNTTGMVSAAADATCPSVNIIEDLKHIHQFENQAIQMDDTLISRAEISRVSSECTINAHNVAVEINMMFSGAIGPKAKIYETDEPNFSYPYFIALTTENGDVIAREVFAATLSYKGEQTEAMTTESMRQIIPLNSRGLSAAQEILIGFQLDDEELSYNRSQPTDPFDEIMPDTAENEEPESIDFENDTLSIFGE